MRINPNIQKRIKLFRLAGKSLDEITKILRQVPRSTVYYHLSKVSLTKKQKIIIDRKRLEGRKKGGKTRHILRLRLVKSYQRIGIKEIGALSKREKFLIGVALYWGEGTKQSEKSVSQRLVFSNSDPKMILCFDKWLDLLYVKLNDRIYTLYLHKQYRKFEHKIKRKWQKYLKGRIYNRWSKTVYKKHQTNKSISTDYLGTLRITVKRSTDLNRKILGLIYGMTKQFK